MHIHNTASHEHQHSYQSGHEAHSERRSWMVVAITGIMMIVEIVCGTAFNSMALLADGWHMATHVGAIGITALAYFFARTHSQNPRFSFGTGKVGALGGFTSAVILALVAVVVFGESAARLFSPRTIVYNEALVIAVLGLVVNLLSAWLLQPAHTHDHGHDHAHHHDHNLRAAYAHVLADAFTSVLAIAALLSGKYFGLVRMDPLMGIVGSFVIVSWAWGLLRQTSTVLLDTTPDAALETSVREVIEADADNKIADFHLWHIAPGKFSAIISLVTDTPRPPKYYKELLARFSPLVHVTVEVNKCE